LAKKVAHKLKIPFYKTLEKISNISQKEMNNSIFQCENALVSYKVNKDVKLSGDIILIDDMVDSKWTLTVCGYLLMANGCKRVIPFALADTSVKGGDNV